MISSNTKWYSVSLRVIMKTKESLTIVYRMKVSWDEEWLITLLDLKHSTTKKKKQQLLK